MIKFNDFEKEVQTILDQFEPDHKKSVNDETSIARKIKIGRTSFMDRMGVSSETEYKRICIKEKRITFHAHIGLNSCSGTLKGLSWLYDAAKSHGFQVDRAGICLDRRMGLPVNLREKAMAETGPMLKNRKEWMAIGQASPIQPHMGDFMIGFPASLENTIYALEAGVTTLGNLSQYFSHEVPGWKDQIYTTHQTVKALSLMGKLRKQGALVHSYLEDGMGALFYDCATVAGWAFLEKYIVETLLGARLAHCIGGLTTDPVKRAGWVFALNDIHTHECIGSMIYGDTISFTDDLIVNSGLVSEYLTWDILAQLKCPTGHAVLPLPLTEGVRIPSVDEIIEVQILGKRIEKTARRLFPHVQFDDAEKFANTLVSKGKEVFNNALDGLKEAGVDIRNPAELLFTLKKIGPSRFEEMFGAGIINETCFRNREPIVKSDMFELSEKSIEHHRVLFGKKENKALLRGRKLLIASTDVHEHAIMILSQLCYEAGVNIIYMGAEKNPDEVAVSAQQHQVDGILLSTHNGMALEYSKELKTQLELNHTKSPVIIGGILNQKTDHEELPVDVSSDLRSLGFITCHNHEKSLTELLKKLPSGKSGADTEIIW